MACFLILSTLFTNLYRFVPPPFTLLMVQRWLEGEELTKDWRALNAISPHLQLALLAAEDSKFCLHSGFDWESIEKAFKRNARSNRIRGGSTITQQTAKNVFLWPHRDYMRKAIETYFTLLIELSWPKDRILEIYLNVAEWGPGIFGAEAATQYYFKKSAVNLSQKEAALLASILPSPNKWKIDGSYVQSRARAISARMNDLPLPPSCGLPARQ